MDVEVKKLADELSAVSKAKEEECKNLWQTIESRDKEIANYKTALAPSDATKGKSDKDKEKVIAVSYSCFQFKD